MVIKIIDEVCGCVCVCVYVCVEALKSTRLLALISKLWLDACILYNKKCWDELVGELCGGEVRNLLQEKSGLSVFLVLDWWTMDTGPLASVECWTHLHLVLD